jgi:uncharacterized membrane protein
VPLLAAAALLLSVAIAIAPAASTADARAVTLAELRPVIAERCTVCHAAQPTHPAFPAAPAGVLLETDEQILSARERIYQQTVVTRVMPIGNLTTMSEDERTLVNAWYQSTVQHDD